MTDTLRHPHLKPDWSAPAIPDGYQTAAALQYSDGWDLDFLSLGPSPPTNGLGEKLPQFASEIACPEISWPWVDGFSPARSDWESIDFYCVDFR